MKGAGGVVSESTRMADNSFLPRHIGPDRAEQEQMLSALGCKTLDQLIDNALPQQIRMRSSFHVRAFPESQSEYDVLERIGLIAAENKVFRSFIGAGYSDCIVPPVIQRNVLE